MTQIPPLNALRAFEAAGRFLNFRAAAEDIGVTQGAVAQQVRMLEARLGVRLFERLPKGLAFTAAGRGYHARIAEAFAAIREATGTLLPEAGKVTISVTPSLAAKWLIPNLPAFTTAHPDIDLRILATEATSSFQTDGVDLAIRLGNPPFGASLDAWLLFLNEVVAVAAPSLLPDNAPVTPERLAGLTRLHTSHDTWPAFLSLLGLRDKGGRGLRFSQVALAIDAALAGQGVVLASRFLVAPDLAAGRLVQVVPDVLHGAADFHLLSPRGARRTDSVALVVEWLLERAAMDKSGVV